MSVIDQDGSYWVINAEGWRIVGPFESNLQLLIQPKTIQIPWRKPPFKRRRELLAPASGNRQDPRPIRADARARLIAALSRGWRWLDEMLSSSVKSIEEIANREGCSPRKVNMTLLLAFLAPEIVKAAIDGRLARGGGISRLSNLPASWREQEFHPRQIDAYVGKSRK